MKCNYVELPKVIEMTNLQFFIEILYIYDSIFLGIRVIFWWNVTV